MHIARWVVIVVADMMLHPCVTLKFGLAALALHRNDPHRAARLMVQAREARSSKTFAALSSAFYAFGGSEATIAYLAGNLDLDWSPWKLHKYLAHAFINQGRFADALNVCEAVVRKEEPDVSSDTVLLTGWTLTELKYYARAVALYRRALVAYPGNVDIRRALGVALWYLDEIPGAYDELVKAYEDTPNFAGEEGPEVGLRRWLTYAAELQRYGDYTRAANACRRALACDSTNPIARYQLANALSKSGDTADAVTELRVTLAACPECEPAKLLLADLLRWEAGDDAK